MTSTPAIVDRETGEIIAFDPSKTADHLIGLEAVKARAARMRNWPTMELAIAEQVALQRDHVAWWRGNVRERGQRANVPDRGLFADDAERITGITKQQTSKWAAKLKDAEKYQAQLEAKARKSAGLDDEHNHRAQGTGENEWYTPAKYIEAARKVLGTIDLDPASSVTAQKTVRAERFFTIRDNGLQQDWRGRVWLNPPYSQPAILHFCQKMVAELSVGNVTEAIMLTHNYTDTAWFHHAESIASAICFTRGRIPFVDQDGGTCAPTQGQAFFYYGESPDRFAEVFREFGFVR